jgi:hypothetical protein
MPSYRLLQLWGALLEMSHLHIAYVPTCSVVENPNSE